MSASVYRVIHHCACSAAILATLGFARTAVCQALKGEENWRGKQTVLRLRKQPLRDAVRLISASAGISILVDGSPLRDSKDIDFTGPAQDGLDRVADEFDYTWTVSKSGIVLMTKRFSDDSERPQANAIELGQSARDIVRAMRALPILDRSLAECFGLLAGAFTPGQAGWLERGGFLRIGDFAPAQRQLAVKAISTNMLRGSLEAWQRLVHQLTNPDGASLQLVETEVFLDLRGERRELQLGFAFRPGGKEDGSWPLYLLSFPWRKLPQPTAGNWP